jgi:hypothetical protein
MVAAAFILSSTMFLACSTNPTEPVPHPAPAVPVADTPAHAIDRFRWALENRSFDSYRTLFTADFVFAFAAFDTNGNAWRDDRWTREPELRSFQHLVAGGGERAPASLVNLFLDRTLVVTNDERAGKDDPAHHRQVVSQCSMTVQCGDGSALNVNGRLALFLVRGDVAALPADLGRAPDSTAWYIERWEDRTIATVAATSQAQPSRTWSWGSLKTLYLDSAPTASRP